MGKGQERESQTPSFYHIKHLSSRCDHTHRREQMEGQMLPFLPYQYSSSKHHRSKHHHHHHQFDTALHGPFLSFSLKGNFGVFRT